MSNIFRNTKEGGTVLLTFSAFESRMFSYQLDVDFMLKNKVAPEQVFQNIRKLEIKDNFNALGYMYANNGLLYKQWVREEILFRLERYDLKKIETEKLELEWDTQVKKPEYKQYPKLWMWLVNITV